MHVAVSDREIYPNAPLQFVAFELRMPFAPRLATLEGTTAVYEALSDLVPIIHPQAGPAPFEFSGPGGLTVKAGPAPPGTRMIDRNRSLSVTVSPAAVVVETSAYTTFEEFLIVLERAVRAVAEATPLTGVQRIGLRYIDEIRVADVQQPADWQGYIHPSLLSGCDLAPELTPQRTEGTVEFAVGDGQTTVMRFGATSGFVVDPNGPLRLRRDDDGPFFLLDLDSFWLADAESVPEFDLGLVLEVCTRLRGPIRALFEAAITDSLREVFRREANAND